MDNRVRIGFQGPVDTPVHPSSAALHATYTNLQLPHPVPVAPLRHPCAQFRFDHHSPLERFCDTAEAVDIGGAFYPEPALGFRRDRGLCTCSLCTIKQDPCGHYQEQSTAE